MKIQSEFENEVQFGELKPGEPFRWRDVLSSPSDDLCMKIESYEDDVRRFNYVSLEDGKLNYADDGMYCKRVDAVITEKK